NGFGRAAAVGASRFWPVRGSGNDGIDNERGRPGALYGTVLTRSRRRDGRHAAPPGGTTAEPKRRFRFPTAFTVLFFVPRAREGPRLPDGRPGRLHPGRRGWGGLPGGQRLTG